MLQDHIIRLPMALQIIIDGYNVVHRKNMDNVFDELLYNASYVCCENEICEKTIYKSTCVTSIFLDNEYYFCDDACSGYGMWSIRYDYKKKQKRQRLAAAANITH